MTRIAYRGVANLGQLGYRVFQRYMAAIGRGLRTGNYTEVQCAACPYGHHCCTLPVYITPFEASAILWFLNVKTRLDTAAWRARIRHRADAYAAAAGNREGEDANRAWFAKGEYCMFYAKDARRCSIYEARPLACRGLYSVDKCTAGRWIVSQPAPGLIQRLIGLMVVRVPSTYGENRGEMATMLARLLECCGSLGRTRSRRRIVQSSPDALQGLAGSGIASCLHGIIQSLSELLIFRSRKLCLSARRSSYEIIKAVLDGGNDS